MRLRFEINYSNDLLDIKRTGKHVESNHGRLQWNSLGWRALCTYAKRNEEKGRSVWKKLIECSTKFSFYFTTERC